MQAPNTACNSYYSGLKPHRTSALNLATAPASRIFLEGSFCKHKHPPLRSDHSLPDSNSQGLDPLAAQRQSAMAVLSFLKNEWSNPPLTVPPMSKQLQDVLWSPFGWDRIDNLTEKAQQALAACMARLAPFGACCIQQQNSRPMRFTRNPEMANPRGFGVAAGDASRAVVSLLLPPLFPLPDPAGAAKIYPTKPQELSVISLSDKAPTSPCRLLLRALVGLTTRRLDDTPPSPDLFDDHLLPGSLTAP